MKICKSFFIGNVIIEFASITHIEMHYKSFMGHSEMETFVSNNFKTELFFIKKHRCEMRREPLSVIHRWVLMDLCPLYKPRSMGVMLDFHSVLI